MAKDENVLVLEINGNWAKIKNGYVSLDYLKKR